MKSQRRSFIKFAPFMLFLFLFLTGLMGQKLDTFSLSGQIQTVDKNFKFIVVNGTRISLSPSVQIVNEKGNSLQKESLRIELTVTAEGFSDAGAPLAQKIVIKGLKRKPCSIRTKWKGVENEKISFSRIHYAFYIDRGYPIPCL